MDEKPQQSQARWQDKAIDFADKVLEDVHPPLHEAARMLGDAPHGAPLKVIDQVVETAHTAIHGRAEEVRAQGREALEASSVPQQAEVQQIDLAAGLAEVGYEHGHQATIERVVPDASHGRQMTLEGPIAQVSDAAAQSPQPAPEPPRQEPQQSPPAQQQEQQQAQGMQMGL